MDDGSTEGMTTNYMGLRTNSYNSSTGEVLKDYYEDYALPVVTADRTSSV